MVKKMILEKPENKTKLRFKTTKYNLKKKIFHSLIHFCPLKLTGVNWAEDSM